MNVVRRLVYDGDEFLWLVQTGILYHSAIGEIPKGYIMGPARILLDGDIYMRNVPFYCEHNVEARAEIDRLGFDLAELSDYELQLVRREEKDG